MPGVRESLAGAPTSRTAPASVLRFDKTDKRIRLYMRVPTPGPELALVEQFIAQVLLLPWVAGCHIAIFVEPSLMSGYPDLLLVWYEPAAFEPWRHYRHALQRDDMRLLTRLLLYQVTKFADLQRDGWERKRLRKTLMRLARAGLITPTDAQDWRLASLDEVLAIRRVVAFEAKMHGGRRVIEQALHHHSLAGETSILLPTARLDPDLRALLDQHHLGFWSSTTEGCQEVKAAERRPVLRGFETILVNEWIGRHLVADGVVSVSTEPPVELALWEAARTPNPAPESPFAQLAFGWEQEAASC